MNLSAIRKFLKLVGISCQLHFYQGTKFRFLKVAGFLIHEREGVIIITNAMADVPWNTFEIVPWDDEHVLKGLKRATVITGDKYYQIMEKIYDSKRK